MREPRARFGSQGRALVLAAILCAACGDDDDAPTRRAPVSALPDEPGASASASSASSACAVDLAQRTPDHVRAVLGDLGYDAIFDDACTVERAEEQGDPSICAAVSVSSLRDRCTARVAIAVAHPSDCPPARTISGRDPLCVALAARDRRLCVAAGLVDGAVCEAALGRARACAELPESERGTCIDRATELASHVHDEVRTTPPLETSLTITMPDGSQRALGSAARGARVTFRGCTRVVTIGEAAQASSLFGAGAIALEIAAHGEAPFGDALASLPSESSSTLAIALDGARVANASGSVSIATLDTELGGIVMGTFHAALGAGRPTVDGAFRTFVRDVDPTPSGCDTIVPPG